MAKGRITSCAVVPQGSKVQVCVRRSGEPGKAIEGPDDVCRVLRGARNADRESFMSIYLDAKNRIIGIDESHKGILAGVEVHPREVFKGAIGTNAAAVIIAHNHPSGEPTPSTDDLMLTRRLSDAGKVLGIPVLDHVIVAENGCTSIREGHNNLFGDAFSKKLDRKYPRVGPRTGASNIADCKGD